MAALDTEMERLRPLVNNHHWDYCVIWRLGDDIDPSRFIEWGACCCSGGKRAGGIKIKDENGVENCLIDECKDKVIRHTVGTKACKKLAQLPSVIPLYSGIHGDVVISNRPKWTILSDSSVLDDESNGTQVLIPTGLGLIELFSSKQVQRDQKIIDYISAHFEVSDKQEIMTNFNLREQLCDPHSHSNVYIENWLPLLHYPNFLPQLSQSNNYSSFEGSSTCSSLSNDHQLLKLDSDHVVLSGMLTEKLNIECVASPSSNILRLKRKKHADFAFMNGNEKAGVKIKQKAIKGPYKSKNLVTERKRRKRINDGMLALRSLVPKITKMDRTATLGDAADYIKEMLETIQNYRDELRSIEEEDYNMVDGKTDIPMLIKASEMTPIVLQVEVIQTGTKDFLLRLVCKQTRGGFSRLMEAIDSLQLQVTDANITTLNGSVLNVLSVQTKTENLEVNALKQSLLELIN